MCILLYFIVLYCIVLYCIVTVPMLLLPAADSSVVCLCVGASKNQRVGVLSNHARNKVRVMKVSKI